MILEYGFCIIFCFERLFSTLKTKKGQDTVNTTEVQSARKNGWNENQGGIYYE